MNSAVRYLHIKIIAYDVLMYLDDELKQQLNIYLIIIFLCSF